MSRTNLVSAGIALVVFVVARFVEKKFFASA
jgi:hypothetical protein